MKTGKEYCHSIHQQIIDLLEKARLGDEEKIILNKLDFGMLNYLLYISFVILI
jgi:hypothetical protein